MKSKPSMLANFGFRAPGLRKKILMAGDFGDLSRLFLTKGRLRSPKVRCPEAPMAPKMGTYALAWAGCLKRPSSSELVGGPASPGNAVSGQRPPKSREKSRQSLKKTTPNHAQGLFYWLSSRNISQKTGNVRPNNKERGVNGAGLYRHLRAGADASLLTFQRPGF